MNRRLLLALVAIVVLVGTGALFVLSRPTSPPVEVVGGPVPRLSPPPPAAASAAPEAPKPAPTRPRAAPSRPAEPVPEPGAVAPAEAAPALATLRIDSDVPGAQVFVDREFVGEAPAIAPDVKPGRHVINLSAKGYEGVSTTLDVTPGAHDVLVKLREVRLDAKLPVVHKHRMGSCTGELSATPRGLRYETTDKGDAFSSPLLDLDAFEVDYLQKNLKIKVRKGKQYDFTDPDGNADHLFVFHRDVDKARDRLRKGDRAAEP